MWTQLHLANKEWTGFQPLLIPLEQHPCAISNLHNCTWRSWIPLSVPWLSIDMDSKSEVTKRPPQTSRQVTGESNLLVWGRTYHLRLQLGEGSAGSICALPLNLSTPGFAAPEDMSSQCHSPSAYDGQTWGHSPSPHPTFSRHQRAIWRPGHPSLSEPRGSDPSTQGHFWKFGAVPCPSGI